MIKDRTRESQMGTSIRQRSLIIVKEAVLGMTQLRQNWKQFKYSTSKAISLPPPPAFPPCQWCCPRIAAYTEACHCPICFWRCQVQGVQHAHAFHCNHVFHGVCECQLFCFKCTLKKRNQIKAPDCFKYIGEDSAYVFEPS